MRDSCCAAPVVVPVSGYADKVLEGHNVACVVCGTSWVASPAALARAERADRAYWRAVERDERAARERAAYRANTGHDPPPVPPAGKRSRAQVEQRSLFVPRVGSRWRRRGRRSVWTVARVTRDVVVTFADGAAGGVARKEHVHDFLRDHEATEPGSEDPC